MKDINTVIRDKEAQLVRINEELAALRLTLRLLTDESSEGLLDEDRQRTGLREEPARVSMGRVKNFP
ncbi:MAG TPA: hypothetical protein VM912_05115 [Terriglobales bacterium]|nr:hypothetical protein [Terriglobales bacterium]